VRAIVSYLMRGRTQATTASALCAALSLMFPPLSYVSGGIIGLATLRNGRLEGAIVILGSVLLGGVFMYLVIGTPYPALMFTLVTWFPVWILAGVLSLTASQSVAVLTAGALGICGVVAIHVSLDDPAAWWRTFMDDMFLQKIRGSGLDVDDQALDRLSQLLDVLAPVMTGLVVTGTVLGLLLSLFLARWWQALLDNPGGFGQEFRALRIDRRLALLTMATALLAVMGGPGLGRVAGDMLAVLTLLYMLQGFAVVHALVAARGASIGWLVVLYVLLSLMPPQVMIVLAVAGLGDTWLDVRARYHRRP
jgi:hypothetical protein